MGKSVPLDHLITVETVDKRKTKRLQQKLRGEGAPNWRNGIVRHETSWSIKNISLAPDSEQRSTLVNLYEDLIRAETDVTSCSSVGIITGPSSVTTRTFR